MSKDPFVIKYRWPTIIGCIMITAIMGINLRNMKIDTDPQNLIPATMSSRINTKLIEDTFGPNDGMLILLETDDILNDATLQRVKSIGNECKRISGVKNVMSLYEAKKISSQDGAMVVSPAINKIPENQTGRDALRKDLLDNELVKEIVISKDFRITSIILTLKSDAVKETVYKKTMAIIKKYPGNENVLTGGLPAFQVLIGNDVARDNAMLIGLVLVVILFVLYSFFKQRRGVVLPFLVVLLSTTFGMSILPVMGWQVCVLSILLPIMVVAFSNNYGLYLITKYRELSSKDERKTGKEIATEIYSALYKPIFFTGVTTIVGILGLLTHVLVPAKQIGIAAAIAIAFSLIVTLFGVPAALSLMKLPSQAEKNKEFSWKFLDNLLKSVANAVVNHPGKILIVATIVTVVSLVFAFLVKVDSNQENIFAKNHPISKCTRLINNYLGGSQNISLMFEGDIKDPALLNRMLMYEDSVKKIPGVARATSIADVIKIMSRAILDKDDPDYDKIPKTRDAVAQYIELYSMNGNPDDFERIVDFNYEKAQVIISINNGTTQIVDTIFGKVKDMCKNDLNVKAIGGQAVIFNELAETIIKGQINSIIFALVSIVLLVVILFKSFLAGVLSSIPLVMSMVLGFGVMGATGIHLDIATAIISSIVMGTGVDFTIQFLWKYRSAYQSGLKHEEAIVETLTTTGRAIAFNAICVVSGIGVLIFSSMPPMKHLAILFTVLTLACMVATLMVVSALCLIWKPKFIEKGSKPGSFTY